MRVNILIGPESISARCVEVNGFISLNYSPCCQECNGTDGITNSKTRFNETPKTPCIKLLELRIFNCPLTRSYGTNSCEESKNSVLRWLQETPREFHLRVIQNYTDYFNRNFSTPRGLRSTKRIVTSKFKNSVTRKLHNMTRAIRNDKNYSNYNFLITL